jgi:parvulin-like peptidyl-prolyl isomerase
MLDMIRKYRAFFTAIFVIAAAGLVISMFGSPGAQMAPGGGLSLGGSIARVDGTEISRVKLLQRIQAKRREISELIEEKVNEAPEGSKEQLRKAYESFSKGALRPEQILESLIQDEFVFGTARKLGIQGSDEAVRYAIESAPDFQREGRFDPLLYRQSVPNPSLVENDVKRRWITSSLAELFSRGLAVSSEAEGEIETKINAKKKFEALVLRPSQLSEPKVAPKAAVEAFVADAKNQDAIKTYYDQKASDYNKGEEVQARHILIRETEGGLKKADEVLAEIKAGKINFQDAAKKYSSDTSNAPKGGDLGFFGRGVMDAAFETAAFGLQKKGDITQAPVKSSFGFHLIELVDRKAGQKKELDTVKTEIAEKLVVEKIKKDTVKEIADQAIKSQRAPSDAELKKLGLKWTSATWTPTSDTIAGASVGDARTALVQMDKAGTLLGQTLQQGDAQVLVRYLGPDTSDPPTDQNQKLVRIETEKFQNAYEFFMKQKFDELEKKKRIVKNEKQLAELKAAFDEQNKE